VTCPKCHHVFEVNVAGLRKKRLQEIFSYVSAHKPTVKQAVKWIMKEYGVKRNKAIEYLKHLEETGFIKLSILNGYRLYPAQTTLKPNFYPNQKQH